MGKITKKALSEHTQDRFMCVVFSDRRVMTYGNLNILHASQIQVENSLKGRVVLTFPYSEEKGSISNAIDKIINESENTTRQRISLYDFRLIVESLSFQSEIAKNMDKTTINKG